LLRDGVSDWLDVLIAEHLLDELAASKLGTILSQGADETQVEEVTNVLIGVDLLLKVGNGDVLGIVAVEPGSPRVILLGFVLHSLDHTSKELRSLVAEAVVAESLEVEPGLLVKPRDHLLLVVNTSTGLEED
jgi:hypothetical protein